MHRQRVRAFDQDLVDIKIRDLELSTGSVLFGPGGVYNMAVGASL